MSEGDWLALIAIVATVFAFWSWCMLRAASDADDAREAALQRETDETLADCDAWIRRAK